jgi:glycosyltransferase involved in cell wall biosynthesis
VLRALALLGEAGPRPLLVVGGAAEAGMDLAAQAAGLGLGSQLRLAGWLSEEDFFLHLRAADLLLALRFPVAGESSGTLARALGMGTPALAFDFGPAAEYPDRVLAKLPFGGDVAPALAARLAGLLGDPAGLRAQGAAARIWVRTSCNIEASARTLAEAMLAGG